MPTTNAFFVRGVLTVAERTTSPGFQCRIAIQTATADTEIADAPAAISAAGAVGNGQVTTVSKNFFDWDCTITGGGLTSTKAYFRIGVLYSSVATGVARGDVIVTVGIRNAR